ncbi:hypothetical protein [Parashewanella tropica]|uniref:hypothetical protein n=1 Tax=Parashewanella tropica TaxID=2547970 RepID=UPI00105A6ACB|nr:hypothetical protein [Parashewanella tropica]
MKYVIALLSLLTSSSVLGDWYKDNEIDWWFLSGSVPQCYKPSPKPIAGGQIIFTPLQLIEKFDCHDQDKYSIKNKLLILKCDGIKAITGVDGNYLYAASKKDCDFFKKKMLKINRERIFGPEKS